MESIYRAACRARSRRGGIAKLGVAVEEADESLGWLESLRDRRLGNQTLCEKLVREADELLRIFIASAKTAARNEHRSRIRVR